MFTKEVNLNGEVTSVVMSIKMWFQQISQILETFRFFLNVSLFNFVQFHNFLNSFFVNEIYQSFSFNGVPPRMSLWLKMTKWGLQTGGWSIHARQPPHLIIYVWYKNYMHGKHIYFTLNKLKF